MPTLYTPPPAVHSNTLQFTPWQFIPTLHFTPWQFIPTLYNSPPGSSFQHFTIHPLAVHSNTTIHPLAVHSNTLHFTPWQFIPTLHFTPWQFIPTLYTSPPGSSFQCHLDFSGKHSAKDQDYSFTYPPLSVARYSFILSDLWYCGVNEIAKKSFWFSIIVLNVFLVFCNCVTLLFPHRNS